MKAALRGSYVEFVIFMGITEKYPRWFEEELGENVYMDESRYTFWTPEEERGPDYYERQLVEDYSVFLRKPNGEVHVTDYDVFQDLYISFRFDSFTNSGIAAFEQDCIEYVECQAETILTAEYPLWFYEYFTEAINLPPENETLLFYDAEKHKLKSTKGSLFYHYNNGEVAVKERCVFLQNRFGEIRGMSYDEFLKYYDPNPILGGLR